MTLTEDNNNATYQIKSCTPGKIVVNDAIFTNSFIISAEKIIKNWRPISADNINDADLYQLLELKPTIIIIGTGEKSIILPAKKIAVLLENNFHVECMSTAAACRTFTVLSSEGRNVVAGMIV